MLRTQQVVFLGVTVNPKTRTPVYVTRGAYKERTVDIWIVSEAAAQRRDKFYVDVGQGYLEEPGGDPDYLKATQLTGYPRAHTPNGVKREGIGLGTCLYTGLVMLATAAEESDLAVPNLAGSNAGICSDRDSRSPSATRWWRRAKQIGLTTSEEGDVDGDEHDEEEIEEDEDLTNYMNLAGRRRVFELIANEMDNHGEWRPSDIELRGTVTRTVSRGGGYVVADIFTYESAVEHNLIAVRDVEVGTPIVWARNTAGALETYKDVILALNVAHEDTLMVAKLARLAQEGGATDRELAAFMMRARFGIDSYQVRASLYAEDELFPEDAPKRTPPPTEERPSKTDKARVLDKLARAGTARPNPPIPIPRRNPETPTAADRRTIEQSLSELDKRRADLGWNEMEILE
jgi:hypothetical protein